MPCRSACLFFNPAPLDLLFCRIRASTDPERSCTSKAYGPHMCLMCVQSLIGWGTAKPFGSVPRRELAPS